MVHDPAITARGRKFRQMVRVEVELHDGTRLERTRETSRAKESFADDAQVVAKFETLAAHALPVAQVRELRDAVLGLDKLRDAALIAQLLARH